MLQTTVSAPRAQLIQTFSPTSDKVIDISCEPYIEAIHDLNQGFLTKTIMLPPFRNF